MPKADSRAGVEGQEDERVRREVLVETFVKEAVRIKFHGCQKEESMNVSNAFK